MPDITPHATYRVTVTTINGEPMLDSAALALMFGVDAEALRALPVVAGASTIPTMWIKRGRRRTREAAARVGSNSFEDVLRYWARQDYDAELEVVYQ